MSIPAYLFHATKTSNVTSIINKGLHPKFSSKPNPSERNYCVTVSAIAWAIAHISVRHQVKVFEVSIFRVPTAGNGFFKFMGNGIYCTPQVVSCEGLTAYSAVHLLDEIRQDADLFDPTRFIVGDLNQLEF